MLGLISKTQAQVISELTEKTTDVLKEGETKSFNWLTYKPTTIYNARPETGTCYSGSGVYLPDENTICFYRIECNKLVSLTCRTVSVKIAPFTIGGGSTNGGSLNNNNSGTSGNIGTGSNSTLLGGGFFNISYNDGQISWLNNPFSNLALSGNLGNPWNFNDPTGGGSIIKANNNPSNPNQTNGPDKGNTNPCFKIGGIKSFKDSCGNCVGGTTPWKPCKKDCYDEWGGTAAEDSCGTCSGGNTNVKPCNKIPCLTDSTLNLTGSILKKMYPDANISKCDSVAKYLNQYMKRFKINNRLRLAHLVNQMFVETGGFYTRTEGIYSTEARILEIFKDKTKPHNFVDTSNVKKYVNCLCLFDRVYSLKLGNGSEASKDGSKYRGRGAIQMTGKATYTDFNNFYKNEFKDSSFDFVNNPELVADNWKFFVISALWEFSIEKEGKALIAADKDNVVKVSLIVNGGSNLLKERKAQIPLTKKKLCLF